MGGRYALIVANGTYRDEKLCRLRKPTRDAEELARVLRDPAIGDFEVDLSVDEPEATLRRRIAAFFAGRGRDDLLLLHFSCHGLKDDSGQLYFAATDTEVAHLDATAVSAEFVSRQMTRSRSRQVVALLDCCYSGAIARGLRFRAGDSVQLDDHLGGRGRVILTASSAMEYAFEGDELTGSGSPSVFTSAVVKGLETGEADRDQDHRISVDELYDYVREQVREVTPDQTPNMISHLEGELYLARSSYVAPVDPAELPAELRAAMASPFAGVREGVVTELARLAGATQPAAAAAARAALGELGHDDSRRVAAAATAALAASEPAREAVPLAPSPAPPPSAAATQAPGRPAARVASRSVEATIAAAAGALLLVTGFVAVVPHWPESGRVQALAATACAAAVAGALLVAVPRLRRGELLSSGAAAAALVGFALGVALSAERLTYQHIGEQSFPVGLTAVGGLLVAGAALWQARVWTPPPAFTPLVALLPLAAVGLALGSLAAWKQGTAPDGTLRAGLALAVLVAAVAGLAGLPADGPGRRLARRVAVAAPAAGAFAVGATLTVLPWAHYHDTVADPGAEVAFWSGLVIVIVASVSLVRDRTRSRGTND